MRCLQAPSFAAGRHFELLDESLDLANANLLMDPHVSACSAEGRTIILTDFGRCRQQVRMMLVLRLSWWRALPWILFGIAHHIYEVAVSCAVRSLQLFEAAGDDVVHHPLALLFCSPDTICGVQLRLFATLQRKLDELPALLFQVARLRFAPVSERYVEGLHALLKRSIASAPMTSAVYIAFHSVQKVLRDRLASHPETLPKLAEFCQSCRNPVKCIQRMGMWTHPAVLKIRAMAESKQDLNRKLSPLLLEVLYHVDQYTLLGDLPSPEQSSDDSAEEDDGNDDDDGGDGGGGQSADGPSTKPTLRGKA